MSKDLSSTCYTKLDAITLRIVQVQTDNQVNHHVSNIVQILLVKVGHLPKPSDNF
jgi:hypothetical protein